MRSTGRLPESLTIDVGRADRRRGVRMSAAHKTLVDLLRASRGGAGRSGVAFTFLVDGEREGRAIHVRRAGRARPRRSRRRCASAACGRAIARCCSIRPASTSSRRSSAVSTPVSIAVPAYPPQPSQASRTLASTAQHRRRRRRRDRALRTPTSSMRRARMMRAGAGARRRFRGSATDTVSRRPRRRLARAGDRAGRSARVPAVHLRLDRVAAAA